MLNTKKEKEISELVLARNLVKERISDYKKQQEQYRKAIKSHEEHFLEKDTTLDSILRRMKQKVFENKVILNALQKQSLEIRKKIVKLNKEQVIKNNKKNGK